MLDAIVKLFAVVGAVSCVLSPLMWAYLRFRIHDAVKDAPAVIEIRGRLGAVETWQKDHTATVETVPRLADTLERLERTLDGLTQFLIERGLEK
jgi:hypothetical protein